jgi:hypothetical protein
MRRRLGMRPKRVFWDYGELFSVTLLLAWWSAMYRMLWTTTGICFTSDLDLGWIAPPEGAPPILESLAWIIVGLLAMTAGCFLDSRNRTRAGLAIGAVNVAFVLLLVGATFYHGLFAAEFAAHRASGVASEWNLAHDLAGTWQVERRIEPEGAPRFPARALTFEFFGTSPAVRLRDPAPELVYAWASLDATEGFRPRTRLFERLGELVRVGGTTTRFEFIGSPVRFPGVPYNPPALVIELLIKAPIRELPSDGLCIWVAEQHERPAERLELRLTHVEGRPTVPDARVWMQRPRKPKAGWDLGAELADPRDRSADW